MELTRKQILDQLKQWRLEVDKYSSKVSVGYSSEGIQLALENLERLSAYSSRLDEIRSQFHSLDASLKVELHEEKNKLKEGTDQARLENIRKWIACGYSSEERGISAFNDVSLLDLKISVKNLESLMFFMESFRTIIHGKTQSFYRAKYDCQVAKDILEMGMRIGEIK